MKQLGWSSWKGRVLKEMTRKGAILRSIRSLRQRKLTWMAQAKTPEVVDM